MGWCGFLNIIVYVYVYVWNIWYIKGKIFFECNFYLMIVWVCSLNIYIFYWNFIYIWLKLNEEYGYNFFVDLIYVF